MDRDDGTEAATRREIPSSQPQVESRDSPVTTAFDPPGDRFELGEEIGAGGMGRVIAATDRALDREVAIKQVLEADDTALALFEREVRITAKLEHPSIVPIHDAGRDRNGRPFYVMRRLQGQQLSERVTAAATPRDRLALIPNVLAAVDAAAFAHARKIIHRDIKPWNILIGAYGETLLIDWGLAREIGEPEPTARGSASTVTAGTLAGPVAGTPGYMAPEQARGEPADERADVYALGATLLHVLSGENTLQGASATRWLETVRDGAPPSSAVAGIPNEVPDELVAIVAKAMAIDPADRYRDAGELASDLRAFLAGKLVAAHHYTTRERVVRFARANRVAITIAAVAIAALVAVGWISFSNVIDERDRADAARIDAEHQRAVADDRAEMMLLDRASTITRNDPTRALALLRNVSPTSRRIARARDIASAALTNGVSHGLQTTIGQINLVLLSSDSKTLVAAGSSGDVYLIDVATAKFTRFDGAKRYTTAGTRSGNSLVLNGEDGLYLLDLSTGHWTNLESDIKVDSMWMVGDRLRYIDLTHKTLVERSLRADDHGNVIARDTQHAEQDGDILTWWSGKRLHIISGGREVTVETGNDIAFVTIDREHRRVAASSYHGVVEWAVDGTVLQRLTVEPIWVTYGPDGLYAELGDGAFARLLGGQPLVVARGRPGALWAAKTPRGLAVLSIDGTLAIIDPIGPHIFTHESMGSRILAARPDSPVLAIGSQDGTIRWFDVRQMMPEAVSIGRTSSGCWVDADYAYTVQAMTVTRYDRRTGAARELDVKYPLVDCIGGIRGRVFAIGPEVTQVVDFEAAEEVHVIPAVGYLDYDKGRYVYLHDREVRDYDPVTRADRLVWTAPEIPEQFATRRDWAVALLRGGVAVRIDRRTGALATTVASSILALGLDGTLWFIRDRGLWSFDGVSVRHHVSLPDGTPRVISSFETGVALGYTDGSLWFYDGESLLSRPRTRPMPFAGIGPRAEATQFAVDQRVVRTHLITGEQESWDMRATGVRYGEDGRLQIMTFGHMAIIENQVPPPSELHAWIDTVTNARIDDTGALVWSVP